MIANAPETWGAAAEVPVPTAKPPPGTEEVMDSPGAKSDKNGATLEKVETTSAFVVEPTLTALEMHAGAAIAPVNPSLPDATTVATPSDRRVSIAGFMGLESQIVGEVSPTILRLTAA